MFQYRPMTAPSDSPLAAQYLDQDTPCRRCGYNLRGLSELGRCPECNGPVILSLLPAQLAVIDPECVERIARGCKLATWSVYVLLISFTVMIGIGVSSMFTERFAILGDRIGLVWTFLGGACLLVSACGLWIATQPHASVSEFGVGDSSRRVTRACLLALPVTILASWIVYANVGIAAVIVPIALGSPFGLAGFVGFWAFSTYVDALAHQIDDAMTIRKAPWYRTGFVFLWIVTWLGAIACCVSPGPGLGFVVALLLGGVLLVGQMFLIVGLATYLDAALPDYLFTARARWEQAEREAESHPFAAAPRAYEKERGGP